MFQSEKLKKIMLVSSFLLVEICPTRSSTSGDLKRENGNFPHVSYREILLGKFGPLNWQYRP
jgi:hypothetical protein